MINSKENGASLRPLTDAGRVISCGIPIRGQYYLYLSVYPSVRPFGRPAVSPAVSLARQILYISRSCVRCTIYIFFCMYIYTHTWGRGGGGGSMISRNHLYYLFIYIFISSLLHIYICGDVPLTSCQLLCLNKFKFLNRYSCNPLTLDKYTVLSITSRS